MAASTALLASNLQADGLTNATVGSLSSAVVSVAAVNTTSSNGTNDTGTTSLTTALAAAVGVLGGLLLFSLLGLVWVMYVRRRPALDGSPSLESAYPKAITADLHTQQTGLSNPLQALDSSLGGQSFVKADLVMLGGQQSWHC